MANQKIKQQWVRKLLNLLASEYQARSLVYDLDDLFEDVKNEKGDKAARRWYRRQAILSLPSLLRHRLSWEKDLSAQAWRVALRRIQRDRRTAFINWAGLTVGLAVTGLVAMWVHYELSFDRFHREVGKIYKVAFRTAPVEGHEDGYYGDYLPGPAGSYLEESFPQIAASSCVASTGAVFSVGEAVQRGRGIYADPGFFDVFDFPVLHGDIEYAFDEPLSVVITHDFARRLFGRTDVVGESINVNGRADLQVTGVLSKPPRNSTLQFDFLFPRRIAPGYLQSWQNKAARVYVRLKSEADAKTVDTLIEEVYNNHNIGSFKNNLFLFPMTKVRLHGLHGGGRIRYVMLFSLLAASVLIMASFNYVNLTSAWSGIRMKEVGVRRVTGAFKRQVTMQLLGETLILVLLAYVAALLIIALVLPMASRLLRETLPWTADWRLHAGLLGVTLATGLLAGLYPAIFLSKTAPITALSSRAVVSDGKTSVRMRQALVMVQFVISIGFVIAVSVIMQQIQYFRNKPLGFDRDNVVIVDLNGGAARQGCEIKEEILKDSRILGASLAGSRLSQWNSSSGLNWPGRDASEVFDVGRGFVDEDFAETLGLEMAQGRFFASEFVTDQNACVINESLLAKMKVQDPIGMQVEWGDRASSGQIYTIVGVVKNFHTESLHGRIRPYIMVRSRGSNLYLKLNGEHIPEIMASVRNVFSRLAPNAPFSYTFLNDELDALYSEEHLTGKFVVTLTWLALFIGCLGMVGLTAFTTTRRVKEIGLRKVLGASIGQVLILMSREFVVLILLANAIVQPLAWWIMSRWLQRFAYRVSLEWPVFLAAGLGMLAVVLLTVVLQAQGAARANPVKSLRYE